MLLDRVTPAAIGMQLLLCTVSTWPAANMHVPVAPPHCVTAVCLHCYTAIAAATVHSVAIVAIVDVSSSKQHTFLAVG